MVKSAAIILKSGKIYTGKNHADIYFKIKEDNYKIKDCGFINEKGEFLDRFKAVKVAYECGQIKKIVNKLFSSDIELS